HRIDRPGRQSIQTIAIALDQSLMDAGSPFEEGPRKPTGRHPHALPLEVTHPADSHSIAAHHEYELPGERRLGKIVQLPALLGNTQPQQPIRLALQNLFLREIPI